MPKDGKVISTSVASETASRKRIKKVVAPPPRVEDGDSAEDGDSVEEEEDSPAIGEERIWAEGPGAFPKLC